MLKNTSLLFTLFTFVTSFTQNFSKDWNGHFSYNNIRSLVSSETTIYAAAENAIFMHNIAENSNREFTTVNGLSGADIELLAYDEARALIIVGFINGRVQIINEQSNGVTSLNDIANQVNIPANSLKINAFFIENDTLYIATGFGIVEYDLDRNIFKNTYLLSDSLSVISDVVGVGVINNTIVASIAGRGTFVGDLNNPNLIEFSNWNLIDTEVFTDFQAFANDLITESNNTIFRLNNQALELVFVSPNNLVNYTVNNNQLLVNTASGLQVLNTNYGVTNTIDSSILEGNITNANLINNQLFFTSANRGLLKTPINNLNNTINIQPAGPESNNIFELDADQGDVWIVHGNLDTSYSTLGNGRTGVARLRNNNWFSIPFEDFNQSHLVNVLIDPADKSKVYISSYTGGLLSYEETTNSFQVFDSTNSNIEEGINFNAAYDLEFSNSGDLWLINNFTSRIAKCFKSTTSNTNDIDFSSVIPEREGSIRAEALAFSEAGNLFVGSWLNGLIGYNFESRRFVKLNDEDTDNIPFVSVRTLAIDLNGQLWLGTNNGIRVIRNPDALFETPESQQRAESIIILDNDGVPQEFLFQQFISDIKVDAENNKWIATRGAGVFFVSADGQETFNHFTTANSPLPTNEISKISIDQSTGNVFIGTVKGLMEFKSNIVEAQEDLTQLKVFPNPVRPEYGNVTVRIEGLTAGANVKITDIEGNLVFEDQNPIVNGSGSGLVEWDTNSFSGNKVASGVYLILITSEDQTDTAVEKLLIVR